MIVVPFDSLSAADLDVDAVYQGGRVGNAGDDPFPRLLSVSNQGGFRYRGSLQSLEMVVLTTTLSDADWPDALDRETGVFTYYGDNKRPGRALHQTPRHGNEILRSLFDLAHGSRDDRRRLPPILVFANAGSWRDVNFLGLAVPGVSDLRSSEDLVAIWKISNGRRFQNYRARLTILDVPKVSREWIRDLVSGVADSPHAPPQWTTWIESGERTPLLATRALEHRPKAEQLPNDAQGKMIIKAIHQWFVDRPHDFEYCAAAIVRMMLPDIASLDVTRPSRDGGRDAIGQLKLGHGPASILVDFAIEAKCYETQAAGVRDVARLISRLRHRQFGVLVTTTYLDSQAYKEIKDDKHPIIVIAARDIVDLLRLNARGDVDAVTVWLERDFPTTPKV